MLRLITLCLPEPYLKALDELVDAQLYPNRAEAIRMAIRDFLQNGNRDMLEVARIRGLKR